MNKIYSNPKWRVAISAIMTAFVAVSLAVLDDWNPTQPAFVLKIVVFVLFSLIELVHLWLCKKYEDKSLQEIAELERQNNAYKTALSGIIQVCQQNATDINNCIHHYEKEQKLDNNIWNYRNACDKLCGVVFLFAKELAHSDNCEISYIKLNEQVNGEVAMFSYWNSTSTKPSLLNKKRNFQDGNQLPYHDMKLFACDNAQIEVISGPEKLNAAFYRTPEQRRDAPTKYNQYIGIPVICDNRKMVGLLQIVCTEHCSIADDEETLMEIAKKYFVPYANLFLLLHKMEKALKLGI